MNSVILTGRLAHDPEIKYTTNTQTPTVNFTLAVDGYNKTNWIRCKAFNKTAENLCKYQKKGNKIGVAGEVDTGEYTNKKGEKVYTTEISCRMIEFLESKKQEPTDNTEELPFMAVGDDEEMPF